VATPDEFRAVVCVEEPMVNTTLPVGVVEPLVGETMAVREYGAPAVNDPPLGLIDRAVVVETAAHDAEELTVRASGVVITLAPALPAMIAR